MVCSKNYGISGTGIEPVTNGNQLTSTVHRSTNWAIDGENLLSTCEKWKCEVYLYNHPPQKTYKKIKRTFFRKKTKQLHDEDQTTTRRRPNNYTKNSDQQLHDEDQQLHTHKTPQYWNQKNLPLNFFILLWDSTI